MNCKSQTKFVKLKQIVAKINSKNIERSIDKFYLPYYNINCRKKKSNS